MSELNDIKSKPASSINPTADKFIDTISSLYQHVESIYRDSTVDSMAAQSFIKGYDKNTQPDLTIASYLKSFNILIHDYILNTNKLDTKTAREIKIVFETINTLINLLESVDEDISKDIISHITGYNFKILKKVYKIS